MKVREIAERLGLTWEGDGEREVLRVAPLETAGSGELAFANSRRALRDAQSSAAGCLIVPPGFDNPGGRTVIRAKDPRAACARAISAISCIWSAGARSQNSRMPSRIGTGLHVAGDHRSTPSIQGALTSGLRAARGILG